MKMTIPSLVASYGLCPDQVGGLEEPLVLDLEENLSPSRVKATWARKATICSEGSKLPSYGSRAGSRKLVGIGLSCILGINRDLPLELSLISSFDLMNSLWISSSLWLTWCSCSLTESIESEEMTSSLEGTCTMSREWLTGYVAKAFGSSDVTSRLLCFYHIAEEDTGDAEGSLVVEDSGRSGDKAMVETRVVVVAGEGDQVCGRQRRQGRLAEVEEGVEGSKAVEEEEGGSIDGSDRDNDATAWQ
ncbi:hypothetical protein GW17_00026185 [Ensete ventricosum]|nr:hypothetical protein GW17_00026185 [Ensete ventricosum]RZS10774.1 hypothetical protein BHM03_00042042 [Ensete ventricosum]